jgi:serine/threonine protein kinase
MSPNILGYGEWLGDIEIVKPVIVLRSSVLYEATHQKKKIFMKVAHPGTENKERLQREAEFLSHMQLTKDQNTLLPVILPPYAGTTIKADPFGKTMLKEHLLYFYLFDHFQAEPLRDILMKKPQLWINHVGWLISDLASALAHIHSKGIYHLGLSPESVLVRFDDDPNVPRILLFDLGIVSDATHVQKNWYPFGALPAYTAPELVNIQTFRPDYRTDVYGLGLTLYELLVGEPAFTFRLLSDTEVYRAVRRNQRVRMNRVEDVKAVADIALQAVDQQIARRQQDARVVAQQLKAYFGPVPGKKRSKWPSLRQILVIIAALLAIAFLLALAISLGNFF